MFFKPKMLDPDPYQMNTDPKHWKIASRIRIHAPDCTYGGLPEDLMEQVPHLGGRKVLHGTGVLGPHKAFVQLQRSQDPRHPTHRKQRF